MILCLNLLINKCYEITKTSFHIMMARGTKADNLKSELFGIQMCAGAIRINLFQLEPGCEAGEL